MFNQGDKLLFALNAKKDMPWQSFKKAVDTLYLNAFSSEEIKMAHADYEIRNWKHATLRNFDALGHCNSIFSDHHNIIKVAPSILTLLPHAGGLHALLTGGRTPKLIEELIAHTEASDTIETIISENPTELGFAPSVISIRTMEIEELFSLAKNIGIKLITTPSAWLLINACGTLGEYLDSLKWERNSSLNWPRREYDVDQFKFDNTESGSAQLLEERVNPTTKQFTFFYCKDGRRTQIDKDWGRLALLSELGHRVMYYDERTFILGVSAKLPLPRLIGRALTLCSGKLPALLKKSMSTIINDAHMPLNLYTVVPKQIATLAAEKLNQILIPVSFTQAN